MSLLTRLSLANRAVISLLCLIAVGVGVYAIGALKQELMPSIQTPGVSIVAAYPGATPETVERDVTEPIESAVRSVAGVTSTQSTSSANTSQISVQWEFGESPDELQSQLRTAVDGADLPEDVDPEILAFDLDALPVVGLAVSSDLEQAELADALETVAVPRLNEITGVGDSQVSGVPTTELAIELRQDDVDRLGVAPEQLQELFTQYEAQLPPGSLDRDGKRLTLEVGRPLDAVKRISGIWLQGEDGPVQLREIADVSERASDTESISRVNGEPALSLNITKTSEGNTVDVSHAVRAELGSIENEIGGNTRFEVISDQAPFIEDSIEDLSTEGGLGLLMAILVILLFLLSFRSTLITAISIPLSLLIALIGLYVGGFTLNLMTLAALTVSVGRVVDDSIVVIENVKRHVTAGETFGPGLIIGAVREVAGAITASTLTTVAVFGPVALVSGQTGELLRPFSITVAIALLASLVVSLTIVPVLSLWFMRPSRRQLSPERVARRQAKAEALAEKEAARQQREAERAAEKLQRREDRLVGKLERRNRTPEQIEQAVQALRTGSAAGAALPPDHDVHESAQTPLQRGYLPVLRWTLRHPVVTIVAAALVFVLTAGLATSLRTDFLGEQGNQGLQITQTLPSGTELDATDEASRKVEQVLADDPDVTVYQTSIGSGGEASLFTAGAAENEATFTVSLHEDTDTDAALDRLRGNLDRLSDAGEIEVGVAATTGSSDLAVEVSGQDADAIAEGTDQVSQMLSDIDGVDTVTSDLAERETKLRVRIDEEQAAEYGMSQATINQAVAQAVSGTTLGTVAIDDRDLEVKLWSGDRLTTVKQLKSLELPVTEKQTADAQERANKRIEKDQEQLADEQERQAEEQAETQQQELRDQRSELADQLDELLDQLDEVRNTPLPPTQPVPPAAPSAPGASPAPGGAAPTAPGGAVPSAPPGGAVPGAPGSGGVAPGAPTGTDPAAARDAQIEQLEEQIDELREQIEATDESLTEMEQQRVEQQQQTEQSEELQERTEDVAEIEGEPVRLSEVADLKESEIPASITRVDGARTVTVSAAAPDGDLGAATAAMQQGLAQLDLPSGVSAEIGGVSQEQNEAFSQLLLAMGIAIAAVYLIMVATFRSLLQPLILLVSVPFAATGAIGLLLATGSAIDVAGMIGMLMLIGIVVTNAIVLIDLINQYRSGGASVDDAVIHGARLRLRPIIMTAAATIMALIPMAIGLTGGGVFISRPLAIVVIGGLVSSTVLTLLLVPVLYHFVEKFREGRRRKREARAARHAEEDGGPELPGSAAAETGG